MSTEAKVGAFTVLGIVLFAAVAVLLSGVSLGGGKDYMVYAGFKEVQGVVPQAAVRLSGVPVGRVTSIENDAGGVTVTLAIKNDVKIPRGSSVMIGSDGVMGDKYVNIMPATDTGTYLKEGDYLIGEEGAGLDTLMGNASSMLEQAQDVLKSIHDITGDPEFQKDIIRMAANMRDTTAHVNGLLAALESTVVENRGNLNDSMRNLNAAMQGLNSTMSSADAMMANLATVGADPQTAENMRLTLANITEASGRIAHIAETLDGSVGDPETGRELKETIHNAHEISDRAKNAMGKLGGIAVKPSADILYSGDAHDWRANFNVDIGKEDGLFLRLGADDIGDGTNGNLQVGKHMGKLTGRAGLVRGDVGVGVDADASDKLRISADVYDPDDAQLRLQAAYRLGNSNTWLMGQFDHVTDSDRRAGYFGIHQTF